MTLLTVDSVTEIRCTLHSVFLLINSLEIYMPLCPVILLLQNIESATALVNYTQVHNHQHGHGASDLLTQTHKCVLVTETD